MDPAVLVRIETLERKVEECGLQLFSLTRDVASKEVHFADTVAVALAELNNKAETLKADAATEFLTHKEAITATYNQTLQLPAQAKSEFEMQKQTIEAVNASHLDLYKKTQVSHDNMEFRLQKLEADVAAGGGAHSGGPGSRSKGYLPTKSTIPRRAPIHQP